jgi:hypothetical protein
VTIGRGSQNDEAPVRLLADGGFENSDLAALVGAVPPYDGYDDERP